MLAEADQVSSDEAVQLYVNISCRIKKSKTIVTLGCTCFLNFAIMAKIDVKDVHRH